MKRSALVVLALLAASPALAGGQSFEVIERGRVLALAGDCIACHTAPGGAPYAGGRALETPFGTLVAPNLTPDRATGIGAFTDAAFLAALRDGIGHDGAPLYPAAPYPWFTRVTEADVLAIRAFLATLDPVSNPVERNGLSFPFSIRALMWLWDWWFFAPGPFVPDPAQSAEWNRGAYLVEGLGHCGACHTGRNALGASSAGVELQGAPVQDWTAPALTGDRRSGLGAWSVDEIVEYLATGRNARAAASGPMGEVVTRSTSQLPERELRAIATYLKALPPVAVAFPEALPPGDPRMVAGAALFADNCAACHTGNGAGVARLFPALAGSAVVQSPDPTTLLRVVLIGAQAAATDAAPTAPAMPAFFWKLSDENIASVLTYIRNAWGNAAEPVEPWCVAAARPRMTQRAGE